MRDLVAALSAVLIMAWFGVTVLVTSFIIMLVAKHSGSLVTGFAAGVTCFGIVGFVGLVLISHLADLLPDTGSGEKDKR